MKTPADFTDAADFNALNYLSKGVLSEKSLRKYSVQLNHCQN